MYVGVQLTILGECTRDRAATGTTAEVLSYFPRVFGAHLVAEVVTEAEVVTKALNLES